MEDVQKHSVHTLIFRSLKRTHDLFVSNQGNLPDIDERLEKLRRSIKARDTYGLVLDRAIKSMDAKKLAGDKMLAITDGNPAALASISAMEAGGNLVRYNREKAGLNNSTSLVRASMPNNSNGGVGGGVGSGASNVQLIPKKAPTIPKPKWHAPWKLSRVISGHLGWVRCIAVEPGNEWFATGAGDRVIKIWDLASGKLKLSLTGHVSTVRGVAVSAKHPYLFSCGEDRQVKCWDLEYNKVIRHYHGHLSAVYSLALHPTIDVLATSGRDSTARIWDMRTKANVHTLTGHTNTVASVVAQATNPQIITGSHDSTVRLWDLAAGKSVCTLTNHKKSVRSIVLHPSLYMFASASPDNIKQWRCPEGNFVQNISGHTAIVNCMAANTDGVLVSGGDNGTMFFWDWRTGYNFQRFQAPVQPGSMDSEAGIFAMCFDQSGTRLITAEADKTIKVYKEDDEASEETHPINWRPELLKRRKF
ncbi:pleiotropic regulator 1 [Drosophila grimshawi]|uniref:Pleiotropic regulator 1 n=1 Tax=Drosophila grimshawi TaxID=7222 RepID=B4JNB7_DROGR|nr:pleiotropic regulator 1 [Drosophila grimshawi]EDV92210.1 GH24167 [Drosophila grimshawi]